MDETTIHVEPADLEREPIVTYAEHDIASFAAKIEEVASPQVALWYEA